MNANNEDESDAKQKLNKSTIDSPKAAAAVSSRLAEETSSPRRVQLASASKQNKASTPVKANQVSGKSLRRVALTSCSPVSKTPSANDENKNTPPRRVGLTTLTPTMSNKKPLRRVSLNLVTKSSNINEVVDGKPKDKLADNIVDPAATSSPQTLDRKPIRRVALTLVPKVSPSSNTSDSTVKPITPRRIKLVTIQSSSPSASKTPTVSDNKQDTPDHAPKNNN